MDPALDALWINTAVNPNTLMRWDGEMWQETGTDLSGYATTSEVGGAVDGLYDALSQASQHADATYATKDGVNDSYVQVKDGKVTVSRGLQHSLHEETDEPTEGYFEKAYICHGDIVSKGAIAGNVYMKDSYEYMTVIHATADDIMKYSEKLPYTTIRCDHKAHIIRDDETGIISASIFETIDEGDTESARLSGIGAASPCMVMMSMDGAVMTLSASNPDLSLYEGPSDEILNEHGERIERSVYGREWIDDPCGDTGIDITLRGRWKLEDGGDSDVTVKPEGNSTHIHFSTREARTEEIRLSRIIGE